MPRRKKKVLRIEFRQCDEWLYDHIHQVVAGKKLLGLKDVSVNFEAARLLKRGIMSEKGTE